MLDTIIKSSRLPQVLVNFAIIVAVCVLSLLAMHELYSMDAIRHLLLSNFNAIELQSHLNKRNQISPFLLSIIFISILFLGIAWLCSLSHFRRLKKTQLNRDEFIASLQTALIENQFVLYYQPIMSVENDKIVDVEALIRWQHPQYGLLSPDVFLPICESNGFIIPLGAWVIKTACHQLKKWHELGHSQLTISINLSANQLNDKHLFRLITETLAQLDIPAHYLKLEITENSLIQNRETSIALLQSLRQIGVQLSLDDFGTGYSSLSYLKELPINHIKIDKSFIQDIVTNAISLNIVKTIIALAKNLNLSITAEGVENKEQLDQLKELKCDKVQGYFYSKPLSAIQFTQLQWPILHSSESGLEMKPII